MRSRKSSLIDSSNYFGANSIVSVGNQQARWLMSSGHDNMNAGLTGHGNMNAGLAGLDGFTGRDRETLHNSLGKRNFYINFKNLFKTKPRLQKAGS